MTAAPRNALIKKTASNKRTAGPASVGLTHMSRVGQNHIYIRCIYDIFGRGITKYTVIYGVYIRFWPILHMSNLVDQQLNVMMAITHMPNLVDQQLNVMMAITQMFTLVEHQCSGFYAHYTFTLVDHQC